MIMNTALTALAGVILGALLQSFLQLRKDRITQKQTLKIKAYTDYMQAAAVLSNPDITKHAEARTLLTDARLRILLYGSPKVIESVAAFDRTGADLRSHEGMITFVPVIYSMRDGDQKQIKREDVTRILFARDTLSR